MEKVVSVCNEANTFHIPTLLLSADLITLRNSNLLFLVSHVRVGMEEGHESDGESFRPRLYDLFGAIEREFEALYAENQLCKSSNPVTDLMKSISQCSAKWKFSRSDWASREQSETKHRIGRRTWSRREKAEAVRWDKS